MCVCVFFHIFIFCLTFIFFIGLINTLYLEEIVCILFYFNYKFAFTYDLQSGYDDMDNLKRISDTELK